MKRFYAAVPRYVLTFVLVTALFIATSFQSPGQAKAATQNVTQDTEVKTTSAGLVAKVAPGELMPISIKLSNFGGGKRVDVLVQYAIYDSSGQKIFSTNETVAVETTNDYVKSVPIPLGIASGTYTVKTSVVYKGQLVPATTEFSFQVEPKILGLFRAQFFLYGGVTVIIGALAVVFGHSLIKRRKVTRLSPLDYSNIPSEQRVFYELISDTVMGMRQKVGDQALEVAVQTHGLVIDKNTGRVMQLTQRPSKVIAELVLGYEKVLGRKVSFSFRGVNKLKEEIKNERQ